MKTVFDFIISVYPFSLLPDEELVALSKLVKLKKFQGEDTVYTQNYSKLEGVDIIFKGEYETFFYDEHRIKHLIRINKSGSTYGGISLLMNKKRSICTVIAKADTEIYVLPKQEFKRFCEEYVEFKDAFTLEFGKNMLNEEYASFVNTHKDTGYITSDIFFSKSLTSIRPSRLVTCNMEMPIYKAAQLMTDNNVGIIFILDTAGSYQGFVTDINIREKVVAARLDVNLPISTIIQTPIVSISQHAFVYEAILMMFQNKIKYLVVRDEENFLGVITRNKLLSDQSYSPFVFIQSVRLANSLEELALKWKQLPDIVYQLLIRGVRAENVNQVITTISDSIAQKIIDGVLKEVDAPPAKFVFMALGSEGRKEQTLKTDQDNAIIYEDRPESERQDVRAYFLNLAEMICDRLDQVGFRYCTGGFMAKNSKWTHSLSHWKDNYETWINNPAPESAMNFSTFFDCRLIYGDQDLIDDLKLFIDEKLQRPSNVLFYQLAQNALQYEPPLTFFKGFKTVTKGSKSVLDIKKAMTPIVDLVRVYALKYRIFSTNTGTRLKDLYEHDKLKKNEYYELLQAYYYMMSLRLRKQAKTIIRQDDELNNDIDPRGLTKIERVTLKEIFKVIQQFQLKMKVEFTGTLR